jgi:hypothetical protein
MEGPSKRLLARQRNETSGQLGMLHARNPRPDQDLVLVQSALFKVCVEYKLPTRQVIGSKLSAGLGQGALKPPRSSNTID